MIARIFVGCAANNEDAESCCALEYTLRKHSSMPVSIEWMRLTRDERSFWSGWNTKGWHTPFSAFRWAIPALCGFEGRAIYSDSDVLFNADIAELWNTQLKPGTMLGANTGGKRSRYDVFVWDCAAAKAHLPSLKKMKASPNFHKEMTGWLKNNYHLVHDLEQNWDCIDGKGYSDLSSPEIKAIHYSRMSCQPHLRHAIPRLAAEGKRHWFNGTVADHPRADLIDLFDRTLAEANAVGFTPDRYAPAEPYGEYHKRDLTHQR